MVVEQTANITYSTLDWSTKGIVTDNGGTFSLFSGGGNLTVPQTATFFAHTTRTWSAATIDGTITHVGREATENKKVEKFRL